MVRTQVYLTKEEKHDLAAAAHTQGISQSNLIRRAIDELLARLGTDERQDALAGCVGLWSERTDLPDLRELRTGWRKRSGG